jgi:hypothetical protein
MSIFFYHKNILIFLFTVDVVESVRYPVVLGVLCFMIIMGGLCILSTLSGVWFGSFVENIFQCVLVTISFISTFAICVSWGVTTAMYIVTTANADFCFNTTQSMSTILSIELDSIPYYYVIYISISPFFLLSNVNFRLHAE